MEAGLIQQVRSFNRLVTERVGALNDQFLGRDRSLGEARLLWELGAEGAEVRELRSRLALDSAYAFAARPAHERDPRGFREGLRLGGEPERQDSREDERRVPTRADRLRCCRCHRMAVRTLGHRRPRG